MNSFFFFFCFSLENLGADASIKNVFGSTALHYLMQQKLYTKNRDDIQEYLQKFEEKNEANVSVGSPKQQQKSNRGGILDSLKKIWSSSSDKPTKIVRRMLKQGG